MYSLLPNVLYLYIYIDFFSSIYFQDYMLWLSVRAVRIVSFIFRRWQKLELADRTRNRTWRWTRPGMCCCHCPCCHHREATKNYFETARWYVYDSSSNNTSHCNKTEHQRMHSRSLQYDKRNSTPCHPYHIFSWKQTKTNNLKTCL